jgi:hypothetical protein
MNKPLTAAEASRGHNRPPVLTPDELVRDFGYIESALAETEKLFNDCPPICEDEIDLEAMRSAVKRFQGVHKRLEAVRVEVKEPYLGAGRIVDGHFNTRKTKVEGWQTKVEGRAHIFLKKKEAAERAEREEAARKAAAEAHAAAEAARVAEQQRIEREQASIAEAFAETSSPTDAHQASADRIEETTLRTVAIQKSNEALKLQEAAEATPADMARTRTGSGLSTLTEIWCFEITDPNALKSEELWEFIPAQEREKAIKRCVALHKDQRRLTGVRIYSDTKPMMT